MAAIDPERSVNFLEIGRSIQMCIHPKFIPNLHSSIQTDDGYQCRQSAHQAHTDR